MLIKSNLKFELNSHLEFKPEKILLIDLIFIWIHYLVSNCTFPQRWEGSWFLSGNQQPIYIKENTLSFRGRCMASDGDKFLIVDE